MVTDACGTPLSYGDEVLYNGRWGTIQPWIGIYDDDIVVRFDDNEEFSVDPGEVQSINTDPTPCDQWECTTPAEVYRKDA